MKKLLIATVAVAALIGAPARAADMAVKAPPATPPVLSWTGFYIGLDVGYGWQDPTVTASGNDVLSTTVLTGQFLPGATALGPAGFTNRGAFGGVEGGYNWQVDRRWLIGIEADFNASDINGQGTSTSILDPSLPGPTLQQLTASQQVQWFGTVRPRLGWLANDNMLLYGTGGFAYGRVADYSSYGINGTITAIIVNNFGLFCTRSVGAPSLGQCIGGTSARVATGWTAGGGVEYRVPGTNASFKAEYLYVNLGEGSVITAASPISPRFTALPSSMSFAFTRTDFHTVKVGLNWHL